MVISCGNNNIWEEENIRVSGRGTRDGDDPLVALGRQQQNLLDLGRHKSADLFVVIQLNQ